MKLDDKKIIVIGGGETATRKIALLIKSGVHITVLAPQIADDIKSMATRQPDRFQLIGQSYEKSILHSDVFAAIVATNDKQLNSSIAGDCEEMNILVNVVDQPASCRFIFPSLIDRSPLVVALSSGGQSPVLLRQLRTRLESIIPPKFGLLAGFAGRMRNYVKQQFLTVGQRRRFWEQALVHPLTELVFVGRDKEAEEMLKALACEGIVNRGQVNLIGTGPGDPDLLTFKALRLMQQADVVYYDRLVSSDILELVRRDAELVSVGKQAKNHTVPQPEINQMLIASAKAGQTVVRLKGGDPFIFGRGGEEVEEIIKAGLDVQVVPGITSASAAACYCGIPLTHRDYAQSVMFATGHLKSGQLDLDWNNLTQQKQTLVIYMGLANISPITKQLLAHGMQSELPVAVISSATRDNQRVVVATLSSIADAVSEAELQSPALIIVGEVVSLYDRLKLDSSVV